MGTGNATALREAGVGYQLDHFGLTDRVRYWNKRLMGKYPMALTADVQAGLVNDITYRRDQQAFAKQALSFIAEEVRMVKHNQRDEKSLRFEDFGIGEGWMLGNAELAFSAGMQYTAWDFSTVALETGRRRLGDRHHINIGTLQGLFGTDPKLHFAKGFALGVFSRILQDNPTEEVAKILANLPAQVLPGGRLVFITIFAEDNPEVPYSNSSPMDRSQFDEAINSAPTTNPRLSVAREEKIIIGRETYTALSMTN